MILGDKLFSISFLIQCETRICQQRREAVVVITHVLTVTLSSHTDNQNSTSQNNQESY